MGKRLERQSKKQDDYILLFKNWVEGMILHFLSERDITSLLI